MAGANNYPTAHVGATQAYWRVYLTQKTDSVMRFAASGATELAAVYLGAIASEDGSKIYWVNESKPLP